MSVSKNNDASVSTDSAEREPARTALQYLVMNTKRKEEFELNSLFWAAPGQKYLCFTYALNNELYVNGINFKAL